MSSTPFYIFSDSTFGNAGLQGPPLYGAAWIQGETVGGFWSSSASAVYQLRPNFIIDRNQRGRDNADRRNEQKLPLSDEELWIRHFQPLYHSWDIVMEPSTTEGDFHSPI